MKTLNYYLNVFIKIKSFIICSVYTLKSHKPLFFSVSVYLSNCLVVNISLWGWSFIFPMINILSLYYFMDDRSYVCRRMKYILDVHFVEISFNRTVLSHVLFKYHPHVHCIHFLFTCMVIAIKWRKILRGGNHSSPWDISDSPFHGDVLFLFLHGDSY